MKRTCGSCGRALRKGAARRAWIISPRGELTHGTVCNCCALRAVSVVVPPPATVAPACAVCRRDLASVCEGCAGRLGANVRELSAANAALHSQRKAPPE